MRIDSSSLRLTSQHHATASTSRQERLRSWVGERPPAPAQPAAAPTGTGWSGPAVQLDLNFTPPASPPATDQAESTEPALEADPANDPKLRLLMLLIEKLTGRRVTYLKLETVQTSAAPTDLPSPEELRRALAQPANGRQGWGLEYELHERYQEAEQTAFQASGVVRTGDGRELKISFNFEQRRELTVERHLQVRAGDAVLKDPLVVNLGSQPVGLTAQRYEFDLDADGRAERIHFVQPGSAFLSLDRDGSGQIENGGELFGARSGDGFAELAAHDTDGNGWIDEQDPVFEQLRLWSKGAAGQDSLLTLAQAGLGALYLGQQATPFALKNQQHDLAGQVRASGLYLREDGQAGSLQQLDLAV